MTEYRIIEAAVVSFPSVGIFKQCLVFGVTREATKGSAIEVVSHEVEEENESSTLN